MILAPLRPWNRLPDCRAGRYSSSMAQALLGEGEGIPEGPWDSDGEVAAELLRRPRAKGERD